MTKVKYYYDTKTLSYKKIERSKVQMLMQNPEEMTKWFENKKQEFDTLAED